MGDLLNFENGEKCGQGYPPLPLCLPTRVTPDHGFSTSSQAQSRNFLLAELGMDLEPQGVHAS